jgi:hypothetical protein
MAEERWRKLNKEEHLKMYTRIQSQHEQQQQEAPKEGDGYNKCMGSNMLQKVLQLLNYLVDRATPYQFHLIQEILSTCPLP